MSIFTLQCECPGKSIFSGFIPTMQFVLYLLPTSMYCCTTPNSLRGKCGPIAYFYKYDFCAKILLLF